MTDRIDLPPRTGSGSAAACVDQLDAPPRDRVEVERLLLGRRDLALQHRRGRIAGCDGSIPGVLQRVESVPGLGRFGRRIGDTRVGLVGRNGIRRAIEPVRRPSDGGRRGGAIVCVRADGDDQYGSAEQHEDGREPEPARQGGSPGAALLHPCRAIHRVKCAHHSPSPHGSGAGTPAGSPDARPAAGQAPMLRTAATSVVGRSGVAAG
jgi:hypothetical protein